MNDLEIKMNGICRLCLSFSYDHMYKLSKECSVQRNIQSCLTVQIHLVKSLPDTICKNCIQRIEDIYEFRKDVIDNQHKLQHHKIKGQKQLENFYDKLKNDNLNLRKEKSDTENESFIHIEMPSNKHNYVDINNLSNEDPLPDTPLPNISSPEDPSPQSSSPENPLQDPPQGVPLLSSSNIEMEPEVIYKKEHITFDDNDSLMFNDDSKALPMDTDYESIKTESTLHSEHDYTKNIKPFSCLTCFKMLPSQMDLVKHYHYEHKDNAISAQFKYTVHGTSKKKYNCRLCDHTYDAKVDILKHVMTHQRPFVCKICGRTYKLVEEIVRHGRAHNNTRLQCSYRCGFTTAYKGALTTHEKRHLEKIEYKYNCEECGKGFFVKTWYEQHQNIHNGLKPYVCDLCDMAFHMDRYLTAHKSSVHKQSSDVKRYVCMHCQHPCDCMKSLTEHLKVHGIKTEFLCDECGKIFENADKLRKHKYTHLEVKPFACSVCNKSFAKKFTLNLHENTHSGEKHHACVHCDKKYVQKATLRRHCRKHHSGLTTKQIL